MAAGPVAIEVFIATIIAVLFVLVAAGLFTAWFIMVRRERRAVEGFCPSCGCDDVEVRVESLSQTDALSGAVSSQSCRVLYCRRCRRIVHAVASDAR